MNYIFLYTIEFFTKFCNHLFIADFGVSHYGPVLGRATPLGRGTTQRGGSSGAGGSDAFSNSRNWEEGREDWRRNWMQPSQEQGM